jgi:hypothetical protein
VLQILFHQYIGAANTKKSAKCVYWRFLFAVHRLFVDLTSFHQYIGATVTGTTNILVEQCRQHQYIGGNIGSKMKILLVL